MTSTASTCTVPRPATHATPGLIAGWAKGLQTSWAQLRARRRARTELLALADLSEQTLDDINAPCWMYLEAKAQREVERQRLEGLRMGANISW